MPRARSYILYTLFALFLALNTQFWTHSKKVKEAWGNVPVPPSSQMASFYGLGDDGLAYRMVGYFLQNLGSIGGRYESLKTYNYDYLQKWLLLSDTLDPQSNYVPFMAAYFFSAIDDPERNAYLIPYLRQNGMQNYPEKWRWFAQAVYIAQYKVQDNKLALSLANELSVMPVKMAPWARQLPAFINLKMGNKDAAYQIMMRMLATEQDKLDPVEVNFMVDYICTRTLDKDQAAQNPLCQKTE